MRIWDINPGYLNRQSLLGEHRELHGIVSILVNHKKGYSHHPETIRWKRLGWALKQRHRLLAAEMSLRGYKDKSPVLTRANHGLWPCSYIDEPIQQIKILKAKYKNKEPGRIPLPENAQQLWSQHKYSVLARDVNLYRIIGRSVSTMKPGQDLSALTLMLTEQLKQPPTEGGIRNALQHMWGYVANSNVTPKGFVESLSFLQMLEEIQRRTLESNEPYLTMSTALGELKAWV
jgi:hypothetical protein